MVGGEVYTVLLEGFRALFIIIVPITAAVTIAGAFGGALQTSTSIVDSTIGYALRLGAAALVLYLFLPSFSQAVTTLAQLAFK